MLTIRDLDIQAPFTPAAFREEAQRNEKLYQELLLQHPPGTTNAERNRAHDIAEAASICADWMEAQEIESAMHVGPFHGTMPKKGERVRIKRGSLVRSTHPSFTSDGKVSEREQVVVVHQVYAGYFDHGHRPAYIHQGEVHWAGTNGYWRWTNLSNVEIVRDEVPA